VSLLIPLTELLAQHPGLEVRRDQRCQVEGQVVILQAALSRTAVVRLAGERPRLVRLEAVLVEPELQLVSSRLNAGVLFISRIASQRGAAATHRLRRTQCLARSTVSA
jgi:hypothetical protein